MAVVDRDRRLLVWLACGGTAVATVCGAAAAATARPATPAVIAVGLCFGVRRAVGRKSTSVLPPGKDVVVLTAVTFAGFLALYLAGWTSGPDVANVAQLLPVVVMGLTFLWPEPNVLRYSLLLAAGTLLGTVGEPVSSRLAVGGALVSLAVALVATNRLTAATGPRLGGAAAARGRRVGGEAIAVLAIVGLLAALASSLLPPPPGQGGEGGRRDRPGALPQPAAPPLDGGNRLDVTAGRGAPGDGAVLMVDAAKRDMWRATTFDRWDGQTWTRARERLSPLADDFVEPGIGDVEAATRPLGEIQEVTVLALSAGVLPAAARPTHVSAGNLVRQGADASLYPAPPLARGDSYLVFSDGGQARDNVLRAIPAGLVPPDVAAIYLQLPQVSPRVRELAAEITAGESTAYGRVRAVENWIDDHTSVTDDAKQVPPGSDPLEAFLFDRRSGPPERAATAMAVMLRAIGIPARIAVGFLPGTRAEEDRPFLVRSRDAHTWVEVWFSTAGWQRFDPTGLAPDAHASESAWDRLLRFLGRLWPLVLLLVLAAGGWLARQGARWWRRRAALPWSTRFFTRVERAGAARGRPREPQETPLEYANGLAAGPLPDPRLAEVGELVTVAAWSRREPAAEDRARAERVLREATKATPVRRLRLRSRSRPAPRPTIAKP